ncbi:sporulation integral membrane protein YlbJ [Marinicrinis lubricantis]|uniref:Sporulation integral membrane protein YlbJ n=1 Tax=Marinicrinis lubricantis TaxID=2086470 RepID=A0ABW1IQG8_9BACL
MNHTFHTLMRTAVIGGASLFMLLFFLFPGQIFEASMKGIAIWWEVLFPSLFPFLVIAELMLGFGIVHFFGTLLDPIMRPLFRVPGIGGFVMAMGFASGYPVGSKLAAQLREQHLITRLEGERLIAFTTTSDPIFLIGAVSVGFFHLPSAAIILAIAHYGGAILIGLIFRFYGYGREQKNAEPAKPLPSKRKNIVMQAFQNMHRARLENQKPIGLLLQDSIQSAIKLIMVIGGLVVFFSVFMECLSIINVLGALYFITHQLFDLFSIPLDLAPAFMNGWFEVTLGARSAGTAGAEVPLMLKCAAASFVLSWGGLSVHAQVASLINRTDFSYKPFLWARLIHGFISAAIVVAFWPWLSRWLEGQTVFSQLSPNMPFSQTLPYGFIVSGLMFAGMLIILGTSAWLRSRLRFK